MSAVKRCAGVYTQTHMHTSHTPYIAFIIHLFVFLFVMELAFFTYGGSTERFGVSI